jgi:hypothetical protein
VPSAKVNRYFVNERDHGSSFPENTTRRAEARPVKESSLRSDDIDDLTTALAAELNSAGDEGEQSVVLTASDPGSGVEVRAALTNDDFTSLDDLPTKALDAQVLGV